MKLKLASLAMLLASTTIASAVVPSKKQLSMSQLTPGSEEFVYAKTLLNTHWNEEGKFEYTLPEDAKDAKAVDKEKSPTAELEEIWRNQLPKKRNEVTYGEAASRNEFGIDGGLFWSKDHRKLAFYRIDESKVQSYPLVQTDDREATVRWRKYPMAGMASQHVALGIYDNKSHKTIFLRTNDKPNHVTDDEASLNDVEHYLTCVTWRPDALQIFVAELNRKQDYMELNVYDAVTGYYLSTLFSIKADKYVEPEHSLYFLPGSNDQFIWQDERDGWDHLYLYNIEGMDFNAPKQLYASTKPQKLYHTYRGLKSKQLTKGKFEVTKLYGADPEAKEIFFTSTEFDPRESHLYSLTLKNNKTTCITPEPGNHRVQISPDFSEVYDTYSNAFTPRICQLINVKSKKRDILYTAPNPYENYSRPEVEFGTILAADGETELYYRLTKPLGLDLSKEEKYPAVVYVYNGPHAQLVTEGYDHGLPGWDCYMAQHGYAVLTVDGRGSAHRGLAFEQAIWHNLGEVEAADQLQGVELLKSLSYIDTERIGVYGWSYGGFMTTYLKLNYPEIFKVGVCGGPVLDWSRYEVMYGERYMGTPEDNPEGYEKNCLIKQADKLKGKLLIIHDDQDETVVPQMSMQFLKNSVEAGTYPDFMLYINHPHNVRGKDRVHLLTRIAQYFFDNL